MKKDKDIRKAEKLIKNWSARLRQIEEEIKNISTNSEIERYRQFKKTMLNVEHIFTIQKNEFLMKF